MKKLVNLLLGLVLLGIFIFWNSTDMKGFRWNQESISHVKANVLEILNDETVYSEKLKIKTGYQKVLVSIKTNGESETIEIDNYITPTHNVLVKEGSKVIVVVDKPSGIDPYYSIYNFDRSFGIFAYLLCFLAILAIVGKWQGMKSALALLICIYIIMFFMVPLIYLGQSPVFIGILTCILCSVYSILILYGYSSMSLVVCQHFFGQFNIEHFC